MRKIKESPELLDIKDEFRAAIQEYQRCVQNEKLCSAEYLEVAILETNAALMKLEAVILKMRLFKNLHHADVSERFKELVLKTSDI